MSLNVIDKYVTKKEHDLLEYAKILESIIKIDDNNMWSGKSEFSYFAKGIIHIYALKYYFDNNKHRSNPIKYSNDNINFVSYAIVDYFKENDMIIKLREWKNETFLLSVILCTACYVDFATNVVDGDYVDTKGKFKYLLNYLKKTKKLIIDDNKVLLNKLFNLVKNNMEVDRKFLDSYKNDNCFNEYCIFIKKPTYYTFDFHFNIPDLEDKSSKIIEKVTNKYDAKLKAMSYELLTYQILEDLISNKEMGFYVIDADELLTKKKSFIKYFDNKYLKEYIKIYISYEDESKYISLINNLNNMGIKILYYSNKNENVDDTYFTNNMEVAVSRKFINSNQDNMEKWNKNNVSLIVKNKEE